MGLALPLPLRTVAIVVSVLVRDGGREEAGVCDGELREPEPSLEGDTDRVRLRLPVRVGDREKLLDGATVACAALSECEGDPDAVSDPEDDEDGDGDALRVPVLEEAADAERELVALRLGAGESVWV